MRQETFFGFPPDSNLWDPPKTPKKTVTENSFHIIRIRMIVRKLSNMFLVSLAIADLLVAIFVMPFAIVNDMQVTILTHLFL